MILSAGLVAVSCSKNNSGKDSSVKPRQLAGTATTVMNGPIEGGEPLYFDQSFWGDGTVSTDYYTDGTFSTTMNELHDLIICTGLHDAEVLDNYTKKKISVTFSHTVQSITGASYGFIGVIGWTEQPDKAKFFIVDDWPTAARPGTWVGNTPHGDYTIDGAEYTLYSSVRKGPWVDTIGNEEYYEIYSVRKQNRASGTIDVSAHIKKWDEVITDKKLGNKLRRVMYYISTGSNNDYDYVKGSFECNKLKISCK